MRYCPYFPISKPVICSLHQSSFIPKEKNIRTKDIQIEHHNRKGFCLVHKTIPNSKWVNGDGCWGKKGPLVQLKLYIMQMIVYIVCGWLGGYMLCSEKYLKANVIIEPIA